MSKPENIYWIGGSPCAGKSSIASILAERYGFPYYRCDEPYDRHVKAADALLQPTMTALGAMSWDELWKRPVAQMVRQELSFYREEFPMILEDIRRLGSNKLIVEGTALLPELVSPLLPMPTMGAWLVPTEEFQRLHYGARAWVQPILDRCTDPKEAFDRWMSRDAQFGQTVIQQARELGHLAIIIDGTVSLDAVAFRLAEYFGLSGKSMGTL